ncbi:FUSC family protein [Tellurirhabdus bombi]|uniref:FUSC family protein n=1 Tax=Tellurirhabdus bombi TaxID=2907205 RepID=UPI001F25D24C|nr:FUSC family membrane protein [Tellurirhabdus bombi]
MTASDAAMTKQVHQIKHFLLSQYFSDGLRVTFALLVPSLIFYNLGQFQTGVTLSMGAVFASIADAPGPVHHRRNGMLASCGFAFAVSLVTGFARLNGYVLGAEVLLLTFFFSMFNVYGNRAAAVGLAALLSLVLFMDRPGELTQVPLQSGLVLLGGLWYTCLSLLLYRLQPYRSARQALGESIREIAQFLAIKARFYDQKTTLTDDYRLLVAQQVKVSEKQDAVRELLFKGRQLVKESSPTGRALVLTFVDSVDLYEQITATYYDYNLLRERFGETGLLSDVSALISQMASEFDRVGYAIQSNLPYRRKVDFIPQLEQLKARIDAIGEEDKTASNLVLRKILVNLRVLNRKYTDMLVYFDAQQSRQQVSLTHLEMNRFVSHQAIDPKSILDNITKQSVVFHHAVRVALACLVGFIVVRLLNHGPHSYWVLLTIIVILKPGFSLTKERNVQRIIGTLAGGLIGVTVLLLVEDQSIRFAFLVVFMIVSYSFQRTNYIVMVLFMTPFILILFSMMGVGFWGVAEERVLDTLLGSVIAFLASYLLFPDWEAEQLTQLMQEVLDANINYLHKLAEQLSGKSVKLVDYKLVRKQVYVSSANLSAAFQRMISEPKNKQRNRKEIHQFVVLNHLLTSNIATLTSGLASKELPTAQEDILRPVRRSLGVLQESLKKFDPTRTPFPAEPLIAESSSPEKSSLNTDEHFLKEQLEFIQRVSTDIAKVTTAVLK